MSFFYYDKTPVSFKNGGMEHLQSDLNKMLWITREALPKQNIDNDEFMGEVIKEEQDNIKKLFKIFIMIKEKKGDKNSLNSMKKILSEIIEEEIEKFNNIGGFEPMDYINWLYKANIK